MDAITLLKADHREVEKLFKAYEKLGEKADVTKERTAGEIVRLLSVHASIEEQVFYPAVRSEIPDLEGDVLEALEEHHVAKWVLSEIDGLGPDDERYDAKVTVLIESVRHHVEEEETEMFPAVRSALGRKRLGEIGERLEQAKKTAPTKPHPRSSDTPPGNVLAAPIARLLDKVTGH